MAILVRKTRQRTYNVRNSQLALMSSGWFLGIVILESVTGAFAWAANLQYLTLFFETSDRKSSPMLHVFSMGAAAAQWRAAFLVLHPIESIMLTISMIFIAYCLLAFLEESGSNRKLYFVWALCNASCVICMVVGMASNIIVAMLRSQLFNLSSDGVGAAAMNDTVTFVDILQQFNDDTASIFFTSSIQPFTEAFVLLLNIFVIVFATNSTIRRIQIMRALGSADTASDAKVIRHIKMVRAAAPLFLLPRALHSALQATVAAFQSTDDACLGVCNISCTNRFALLRSWLDFHPELHTLVVLVSALLLLLTIWSSGRVDRVQQRFNALYVPSHDRNSQLLRHDSLSIHLHRNLPIRHARSITTEDLDRSTSSYLHSPVPATASNEPSRCR